MRRALRQEYTSWTTQATVSAVTSTFWSGRRDSNPRPSPWQGDALPTEPRPRGRHNLSNPVLAAHQPQDPRQDYEPASARSSNAAAGGAKRSARAASRPAGLIFLAVFCRMSTVLSSPILLASSSSWVSG